MEERIKGILLLCAMFWLITGKLPDFDDPECQRAIRETLS